ncbi:MAG: glutaredoxin family protein [Gammaproteobacteria bacterium]
MPEFIVYSRRGCHLCELMLEELEPLCRGKANVMLQDVDDDPVLADLYGDRVPVLCSGDAEMCHFYLDKTAFLAVLNQA